MNERAFAVLPHADGKISCVMTLPFFLVFFVTSPPSPPLSFMRSRMIRSAPRSLRLFFPRSAVHQSLRGLLSWWSETRQRPASALIDSLFSHPRVFVLCYFPPGIFLSLAMDWRFFKQDLQKNPRCSFFPSYHLRSFSVFLTNRYNVRLSNRCPLGPVFFFFFSS